MALYTGTITNANPAQAYVAQLETDITTYNAIGTPDNATYTKVESVTSVSGWQFEVYKSNGTTVQLPNTFGADYYLFFGYQTAGGSSSVEIGAGTGYLTGTDSIIRPVSGTVNTLTVNSDYSFGDTTNGITLRGTGVAHMILPSLPTTGYEYYHIINRDGMFLGAKYSVTDIMAYAGLFDPAFSYAGFTGAVPLCLCARSTSSTYSNVGNVSATIATAFHPNIATGSNTNSPFQHTFQDWGPSTRPGDYQTADRFTGKAEGLRLMLMPVNTLAATTGIVHGWLKNCFSLGAPGAARLGDTLTFDSKVHLDSGTFLGRTAGTSNSIWIDTEAL